MVGEPTNTEISTTGNQSGGDPANTEGSREPKTEATALSGPDVGAAAPESGAAPQQKQQGADRPMEVPEGKQEDAIANKKAAAENAMSQDIGDGPKPLGEEDSSEGGQKESMGSTSTEKGTGTQYVKSSGVAAEGGDFDATKPGAGKEADRECSEYCLYSQC